MTEQFWNSERLATLRALWDEGFTGSQIGMRMGCSANAVSSARNKYGLPKRREGRGNRRGMRKELERQARTPAPIVEYPGWPTKAQLMAGR